LQALGQSQQILALALPAVVHAFAVARAPEVRTQAQPACVGERARQEVRDLVLRVAPEQRLRMRDDHRTDARSMRAIEQHFDAPGGAVEVLWAIGIQVEHR
jgi:hypothetical protein